jgi:DNA-binding transcriptional regulator YdaS (Cro superfamily)
MTTTKFYKSLPDKTAFAIKCGISQPYLSQIFNGLREPKWKIAKAIARASRGKITAIQIMEIKI